MATVSSDATTEDAVREAARKQATQWSFCLTGQGAQAVGHTDDETLSGLGRLKSNFRH